VDLLGEVGAVINNAQLRMADLNQTNDVKARSVR